MPTISRLSHTTPIHFLACAIVVATVCAAGRARAQEPSATMTSVVDQPGLDLGIRLGYVLPMGKIDPGANLGDMFSGGIPIVLEAGYRVNPNVTVGALFQYGFTFVKDGLGSGGAGGPSCGNGVDCSGHVIRLGVEGIFHVPVTSTFAPWLGIGTGYEWMSLDLSAGGQSASASARGWEFATFSVGGDFRLAPQLALGPFVSVSLAQYVSESLEGGGMNTTQDVTDKSLHEWLQFGVRGTFNL